MTREQIESLNVGDEIQETYDTSWGKPLPDARWTPPRKITRIFARGISVNGHAYACGYAESGPDFQISFSVREDETRIRLAEPDAL